MSTSVNGKPLTGRHVPPIAVVGAGIVVNHYLDGLLQCSSLPQQLGHQLADVVTICRDANGEHSAKVLLTVLYLASETFPLHLRTRLIDLVGKSPYLEKVVALFSEQWLVRRLTETPKPSFYWLDILKLKWWFADA